MPSVISGAELQKDLSFVSNMNEPHPSTRRSGIARCFEELHLSDGPDLVTTLGGLWKIAAARPDDPEFPSLGIFKCMAKLINRAVSDRKWLLKGKNVYIPYYAAHIIGSYTMNRSKFAEMAVESGVLSPLMELLRGSFNWVEQRVAVRALGHLASHKRTFDAVAAHEEEIVTLAMKTASTCIGVVYDEFVRLKVDKRLEYQRGLMARKVGVGDDLERENKKAEEWAGQIQSWSLYLLNCFAEKQRSINLMCGSHEFLKDLCGMWGGSFDAANSFSGFALIRSLCGSAEGRESVSNVKEVIDHLCEISRSSGELQFLAIDSLISLLKDSKTRHKVINVAAVTLVDLVEHRSMRGRAKVGDTITQTLLQDYCKIKFGERGLKNERSQQALEEAWDLRVEKRKRDKMMSEQEFRERKLLVSMLKREGNKKFWANSTEEAVTKYTKALDLCPLKIRKERVVLYSNRAQCYLLLREQELAVRDATRALCLSGSDNPHLKSLWRRSQAYDMKGLSRLSLMDCLMYINERSKLNRGKRGKRIPNYAVVMLNKQAKATWIFSPSVNSRAEKNHGEPAGDQDCLGNDLIMRRTNTNTNGRETPDKLTSIKDLLARTEESPKKGGKTRRKGVLSLLRHGKRQEAN